MMVFESEKSILYSFSFSSLVVLLDWGTDIHCEFMTDKSQAKCLNYNTWTVEPLESSVYLTCESFRCQTLARGDPSYVQQVIANTDNWNWISQQQPYNGFKLDD